MIGRKLLIKQKKPIRVCLLIDAWSPVWGGGQTHVWEISKILVTKYDCEIDIVTRSLRDAQGHKQNENEYYLNNHLRIIRVGSATNFFNLTSRCMWLFTASYVVMRRQKYRKYDLIHGHAYTAAIPTKIVGLITKIPTLFTIHGSNYLDLGEKSVLYFIERFLLTQINFNAVISVTQQFLKYKNVNNTIKVIPNGVNIEKFVFSKNRIKNNWFTLLWVGRFDQIKAVDQLLKAFALARPKKNKLKLLLIGYGYEEKKLKELVGQLQIEKFVNFVTNVSSDWIINYYYKADLFVLPSYSEGLAISLLEAMAAKMPVIVSNVGDHARLIKDNFNGYVLPANYSIEYLANTIIQAKNNQKLKSWGKKNQQLVKKKYTWLKSAQQTYDIYKELITKNV